MLGSTRGTALQGVLDAVAEGRLDVEIALVIADKAAAPILERAARHGVKTMHLDAAGLKRAEFDERVSAALRDAGVDLVLMIGYMRIVSAEFVETWRGRLLNVHPSLLPAFGGMMNLSVHEAVLASGVTETGCTIHQVTEAVDAGPIVLQKRCAVLPGDTVEALKKRVQALEQQAFVAVLRNWRRRVKKSRQVLVGVVMGSKSDWPTMEEAAKVLAAFGIAHEVEVVSAHRTPDKMMRYAASAQARGLRLIIAGAGGAAHLPGMIAAKTSLPVLGVPVKSKALDGLDSLLSIAQMPAGIPVATFAIGVPGAKNAGLFAASVLALEDARIAKALAKFRSEQTKAVLKERDPRR